MNNYRLFLATTLALLIAGCASNSIPDPEPEMADANAGDDVFQGGDVAQEEQARDVAESQPATVTYFDYDQDQLTQAVRNVLLAHGVSGAQLSTVSYGEERPAVSGSDEQSYAMNRRVEISYVN